MLITSKLLNNLLSFDYPSNKNTHCRSHNQSTLASLPMIGIDDFSDPTPPPHNMILHHTAHNSHPSHNTTEKSPITAASDMENGVGEMSDSSSSSSDSDSDSDVEEVAPVNKNISVNKSNGYSNNNSTTKIATHLLNEDLCLSESGSDSE